MGILIYAAIGLIIGGYLYASNNDDDEIAIGCCFWPIIVLVSLGQLIYKWTHRT